MHDKPRTKSSSTLDRKTTTPRHRDHNAAFRNWLLFVTRSILMAVRLIVLVRYVAIPVPNVDSFKVDNSTIFHFPFSETLSISSAH